MTGQNPSPFGNAPAPTNTTGVQTAPNPSAQSFTPGAVVIATVVGLILGVIGTLFGGWLTAPPPTALAAQSGTGTTLTAPTNCPTGDKIYQARINGDEGQEVKDGKLVPGDERVLVKAKYDGGSARDVTIKVSARKAGVKPVIDGIHAWTPQAVEPGETLKHTIIRYAVQSGVNETVLEQTKTVHGKDTTVFVCVAVGPR